MTIEAPEGAVILKAIQAKSIQATPLDGGARALSKPVPLTKTANGWQLDVGSVATPWYLIQVTR